LVRFAELLVCCATNFGDRNKLTKNNANKKFNGNFMGLEILLIAALE
jgi:hypothetical protein